MAVIKPFQCIRPAVGLADRIAALPYDVYSRQEARAEAKKNPQSFLNIDRPETQFEEEQDMYAPKVYEKAAQLLRQWLLEGKLVREKRPGYYVYELTMEGRIQTGLTACASIDDYLSGVIKEHEKTREDKEQDRIRHVDVCCAQTGPIYLAYRKNLKLHRLLEQAKEQTPLFAFTSEDGIIHRGWEILDPAILEQIEGSFREIREIYIADGHHRAASAVKVGLKRRQEHLDYDGTEEFNYFLSVLFPDEELKILPYNRAVRDLNGFSVPEFLEKLRQRWLVERLTEAKETPTAWEKEGPGETETELELSTAGSIGPESVPGGSGASERSEPESVPGGSGASERSEPESVPGGSGASERSEPESVPGGGEASERSEPESVPGGGEASERSEPESAPGGSGASEGSEPESVQRGSGASWGTGQRMEEKQEEYLPMKKGQVSMYLKDQWYRLTLKPEYVSTDPVEGLDVSLLQNHLLSPILGIGDPRRDQRLVFVGGIRGMEELERRVHTDCAAAFALYPTSIRELFAVADAGRLMPPKSTWFEPKLRSGLFIHEIEA